MAMPGRAIRSPGRLSEQAPPNGAMAQLGLDSVDGVLGLEVLFDVKGRLAGQRIANLDEHGASHSSGPSEPIAYPGVSAGLPARGALSLNVKGMNRYPPEGVARGGLESVRRGAGSQWIVAARPLCHLQCPVAYLSRLQRIRPAARLEFRFKAAGRGTSAAAAAPRTRALGGRQAPTAGRGSGGGRWRRLSSLDSDLEAFSHNPAHGSFAPLAFQPSAMTNCANQRFLSY